MFVDKRDVVNDDGKRIPSRRFCTCPLISSRSYEHEHHCWSTSAPKPNRAVPKQSTPHRKTDTSGSLDLTSHSGTPHGTTKTPSDHNLPESHVLLHKPLLATSRRPHTDKGPSNKSSISLCTAQTHIKCNTKLGRTLCRAERKLRVAITSQCFSARQHCACCSQHFQAHACLS